MKKILGIIVVGLLLNNCATVPSQQVQKQLIDQGTIKKGMTYDQVVTMLGGYSAALSMFPFRGKGAPNEYMYLKPFVDYNNTSYYYSFKADVSEKSWGGWYKLPFYRLEKIWDNYPDLLDSYLKIATNPDDISWLASEKTRAVPSKKTTSTASSSTINTADKITQSKQVCRDLGFKDDTPKFSDCALKMMSIQFQTTNKVASASGGTTQEVIVTHRNDYDIWDALVDYSRAIDPKNKSTTSSSSSNRGTNCVIGRTNPTFGTTTMNCN